MARFAPPDMRLLGLLIVLIPMMPLQADEWWAWSALEFWQEEDRKAFLFLGNRLDTEDGAYVQIVSPRYRQDLLPWLGAGIGLSLLSIENTRTGDRFQQFRPELELNPHMALSEHLELEWRNRMEWRWNEGQAFTTHRTRHRLQLSWKLPKPVGPVTRVFASNEILTDLHRGQWTENRLIPAGITFKVGPDSDLDLFYMVFSSRASPDWQHEPVVGTFWRVRF